MAIIQELQTESLFVKKLHLPNVTQGQSRNNNEKSSLALIDLIKADTKHINRPNEIVYVATTVIRKVRRQFLKTRGKGIS